MFNRIGRLAIAGAVGVIVGAGIIVGITQMPESDEANRYGIRHMVVETSHLVQGTTTNFRHHEIVYMAHDRSCRVQDGIGDGGDTLEIIVWDAIPTYDLMVYPARIIECETRRK